MNSRILVALALPALLTGCLPVEGSAGIGDPYAPDLGNGGYDVLHYTVSLDYDPATNDLGGSVSIEAIATAFLRSFNLDFYGLHVDSIEVNDSPATYSHRDHELKVTPVHTLRRAQPFSVRIEYHGTPLPIRSRYAPSEVGWFRAQDESVNVINYPDGAETWFPSNDHQRDKATYRFEITVPSAWFVLAPGSCVASSEEGSRTRYVYEMNTPMDPTSAVFHIDKYDIVTMSPVDGVELKVYFTPETPDDFKRRFSILPEALRLLSDSFGPYPFDSYAVAIADASLSICAGDGLANSGQTVTLQCPTDFATDQLTIVHELAHQWFGNSVGTISMQESWLYEGPATYVEWMWLTRGGGLDEIDKLARVKENAYYPKSSIGKPPMDDIGTAEVYLGGALLLHALRLRIGEDAFFGTMRTFLTRYQYGNISTTDFIQVAEDVSGEDLKSFFDAWLYEVNPPPLPDLPR